MSDYTSARAANELFGESMGSDSEAANERSLEDPRPYPEPDACLDEINAMGIKELEQRLPQARHSVEAIESKLEKLMVLRDSAIICAAAMAARLTTLKQAGGQAGQRDV